MNWSRTADVSHGAFRRPAAEGGHCKGYDQNPKLLLCDELTGALDTRSSKNVLQFVEKMNRQYGTTVVIITHNEAIAKMADQIIWIRDGRVEKSVFNEKKIPAEELEL